MISGRAMVSVTNEVWPGQRHAVLERRIGLRGSRWKAPSRVRARATPSA
jgi:hypothetical protein